MLGPSKKSSCGPGKTGFLKRCTRLLPGLQEKLTLNEVHKISRPYASQKHWKT